MSSPLGSRCHSPVQRNSKLLTWDFTPLNAPNGNAWHVFVLLRSVLPLSPLPMHIAANHPFLFLYELKQRLPLESNNPSKLFLPKDPYADISSLNSNLHTLNSTMRTTKTQTGNWKIHYGFHSNSEHFKRFVIRTYWSLKTIGHWKKTKTDERYKPNLGLKMSRFHNKTEESFVFFSLQQEGRTAMW